MKSVRLLWLTLVVLVAAAAPAGASTSVLANQRYQWFWWIAPILAASFILMLLSLSRGYIKKVLIPKYRGRKAE